VGGLEDSEWVPTGSCICAEDEAFERCSVTGDLGQPAEQLADRCEWDGLGRLESNEAHASGSISLREDLDEESGLAGTWLAGDEDGSGRSIGPCALPNGMKGFELVLAADERRTH